MFVVISSWFLSVDYRQIQENKKEKKEGTQKEIKEKNVGCKWGLCSQSSKCISFQKGVSKKRFVNHLGRSTDLELV